MPFHADWVEEVTLEKAILHSSTTDLRFNLFLCVFYGFIIWAELVPQAILSHPLVIGSVNLEFVLNTVRDTYIHKVCSSHPSIPSPCDCGEPLNKIVKHLIPECDEFYTAKKKTYAFMVGMIILTLALSETVSQQGIYLPLDVVI